MTVAALYVEDNSVYKTLDGVEAWDRHRDATGYRGPHAVVAHPPCGPWGRFHWKCDQDPTLALRAVEQVRQFGGVLEHPKDSRLWRAAGLPAAGCSDWRGGRTLLVNQSRWGHRAPKPTWLYIVGVQRLPPLPPDVPDPGGRIEFMSRRQRKLTPPRFAAWLVDCARRVQP